ncbi:MAG TPA: Gx transporter family protein [Fervidobacterium sp.]|nr:Gx transporter family protein [Fervidobacterium sp.]HOM74019.1 Gx transporter family protein [Fervidobacterium sp.]HOQ39367.1 Gx transporter family protein [Fervidobacterium sp.]HPP17647.1 Gx transporter family protein [Fervidobacterium sp.]HPT53623.1 Gx transporter family protein [Fervidobacterium sp.]
MRTEQDDHRIQKEGQDRKLGHDRRTDVVTLGVMVAISSVVYALEGLIPFPVPGGKWGFSNFLVLYLSFFSGITNGIILAVSKSLLGSILSGTILTPGFFMGFLGSLAAAILQGAVAKLDIFGLSGISIIGMLANNIVQFLVGSFLIGSPAIYTLLPLVIFLGSFSALANAYLAKQTEKVFESLEER